MNRIKKAILIISFLGLSVSSFAQFGVPNLLKYDKRTFLFGFSIGYNVYDFKISPILKYDSVMMVTTKPYSGFSLGIVTNLCLGKYFDLRFIPSFSFSDRHVNYAIRYYNGNIDTVSKKTWTCYSEFPLLLKFKSSRMLNNIRAYVIAGGQISVDLMSAANKVLGNGDPKQFLKLKPFDIQGQVGVGFDFYCTYFKFSTELKMSFGGLDVLKKEDNLYSECANKLYAKNLTISFIFE